MKLMQQVLMERVYLANGSILTYRDDVGKTLPAWKPKDGAMAIDHIIIQNCSRIETLEGIAHTSEPFDLELTRLQSLTSLEGITSKDKIVELSIITCPGIKTLETAPLNFYRVTLKDLNSFTRIGKNISTDELHIWDCPKFTSFKTLVEDKVYARHLQLSTTAESIPKDILNVLLIPRLKDILLIDSYAGIVGTEDESIKEVMTLVNKHLPNTSGMKAVRECQSELADAGLEEWARL